MRRLTLAALALAGSAAMANAADMAIKAPAYAPAPVAWSWAGPYIGLNLGYGWGQGRATAATVGGLLGGTTGSVRNGLDGVIGGAQIGYNWQAGMLVLGAEADIQASGQSGTATVACGVACTISGRNDIDWFATLRGRLGIAVGQALIYGTAGWGWGNGTHRVTATAFGGTATLINADESRNGWTAGFGTEWAFAPNWSAKVEYLYMRSNSRTYVVAIPAPVGGIYTERTSLNNSLLRVGVNYRF